MGRDGRGNTAKKRRHPDEQPRLDLESEIDAATAAA
jgi:hypothetical protein